MCPPCSTTKRRPLLSSGCCTTSGVEKPDATGTNSSVAGPGGGGGKCDEEVMPAQLPQKSAMNPIIKIAGRADTRPERLGPTMPPPLRLVSQNLPTSAIWV